MPSPEHHDHRTPPIARNLSIWKDDGTYTKIIKADPELCAGVFRLERKQGKITAPCEVYYPEPSHVCDQHAVLFNWEDGKPEVVRIFQKYIACELEHQETVDGEEVWACSHDFGMDPRHVSRWLNETVNDDPKRLQGLADFIQHHTEHLPGGEHD